MLFLTLCVLLFTVHGTYPQDCRTVVQGGQFSKLIPFHGFKSALVITTKVRMDNNTAWYVFPPTEPKGQMCSYSWNKLWGSSRCGYFNDPHQDSDRFMWRRVPTCLIYNSSGIVIGQNSNCPEANLIDLTAAAYDSGVRPYENEGTLLKTYSTRLQVGVWYQLKLIFSSNQTIYELSNNVGALIESKTINHRVCSSFNQGAMQSFYFGGQCVAPQAVTACYQSVN